jgi:hypothetical protein
MLISGRRLLLGLSVVIAAVGIVMWLQPDHTWLALVIAACGLVSILVLNLFRPPMARAKHEPDSIDRLPPARRRELIRGTSLYLREMEYRYSIRPDPSEGGERKCFSAEVNTVRLGFVPVLITDNTTDRQGYGYMAFVHDGRRWRGPGLPCPAGQAEAVRHAARSVSPLATEEETSY